MTERKLRVLAAGDTLVANLEAEEAGARRFIGRRFDGEGPNGEARWTPTDEPVELPYRAEYVSALKAGDLDAADDETARLAGLEVDRDEPPVQPLAYVDAVAQQAAATPQQPVPPTQQPVIAGTRISARPPRTSTPPRTDRSE